jgi:hypothetical protein
VVCHLKANYGCGERCESVDDRVTAVIANAHPAESFDPADCPFYNPSNRPQMTAMFFVLITDMRVHSQKAEELPMRFAVVSGIAVKFIGMRLRASRLPANFGNLFNRWHQFIMIALIRWRTIDNQWNAMRIDDQSEFRPFFPPIHGARAGFISPTHGANLSRINDCNTRIEDSYVTQQSQQFAMDGIPDSRLFPISKTSSCRFSATSHDLGDVFPATSRHLDVPNDIQNDAMADPSPSSLSARRALFW